MWTLVGAGLKEFGQSGKPMASVLPKNANWFKTKATSFDPDNNKLKTEDGTDIEYEYLVLAMGLQTNYDQVDGLLDALTTPQVCSNYHPKYVLKTPKAIANFKSGNAVFTFPKPPLKCPGAPQKIAYLTERALVKVSWINLIWPFTL